MIKGTESSVFADINIKNQKTKNLFYGLFSQTLTSADFFYYVLGFVLL